jgi:TPR repeat protein
MGSAQSLKSDSLFRSAQSETQPSKRATLYFEASQLGHPDATYHYALCLESGNGIKPDPCEALKYFTQAASAGCLPAIFRVAMHCPGTPESIAQLEYCVEKGYSPAICALAMAQAEEDRSRAVALLNSAPKNNSMAKLGRWLISE